MRCGFAALGGEDESISVHVQALISLNAMYDKQRCAGQEMPCEAEFRAYHLLTLIGTHGKYRYDGTEYQGALAVSGSSFMCARQASNLQVATSMSSNCDARGLIMPFINLQSLLYISPAIWRDAPGVLLAWQGVIQWPTGVVLLCRQLCFVGRLVALHCRACI